jgi:hypothetical protein
MADQRTTDAIEASDTDDLLRIIDGHAAARRWDQLVELRMLCREAGTRGKQLWGVEEHIRYRLALEAPASFAGPVVSEGPARFTPGPLSEVAASTHTFSEMEPYLSAGPARLGVAQERAVAGEDLSRLEEKAEVPLRLLSWEPEYPLAVYHPDRVEARPPPLPAWQPLDLAGGEAVDDPDGCTALLALTATWVEESNGRAAAVCAEGGAAAAIHALGVRRALAAPISFATALASMCWAGASGGAHGKRRGAAAGRAAAWWAVAALTDTGWPPTPDLLGERGGGLTWWAWSDLATGPGWDFHLAVASPAEGLAWAVAATDAA